MSRIILNIGVSTLANKIFANKFYFAFGNLIPVLYAIQVSSNKLNQIETKNRILFLDSKRNGYRLLNDQWTPPDSVNRFVNTPESLRSCRKNTFQMKTSKD